MFSLQCLLCFTHYTGQSTVNNFFKSFLLSVPMYMCNSMHYQICNSITKHDIPCANKTEEKLLPDYF